MSIAQMGKGSGCNNNRAVKVIDTETKIVYCSIDEAIKAFNISRTNFNRYMKGILPNKTPLRYHFKDYIKDYPNFENE